MVNALEYIVAWLHNLRKGYTCCCIPTN